MAYGPDYIKLADATSAYAREHCLNIQQALRAFLPTQPYGRDAATLHAVASVLGSRSHIKNKRAKKVQKTGATEVPVSPKRVLELISHRDYKHSNSLPEED